MVTTFNSKDIISFGAYLLSDERKEYFTKHYEHGDKVSIEERLKDIYHADVENWKEKQVIINTKNT